MYYSDHKQWQQKGHQQQQQPRKRDLSFKTKYQLRWNNWSVSALHNKAKNINDKKQKLIKTYSSTQWPAVATQYSLTRAPPQRWVDEKPKKEVLRTDTWKKCQKWGKHKFLGLLVPARGTGHSKPESHWQSVLHCSAASPLAENTMMMVMMVWTRRMMMMHWSERWERWQGWKAKKEQKLSSLCHNFLSLSSLVFFGVAFFLTACVLPSDGLNQTPF